MRIPALISSVALMAAVLVGASAPAYADPAVGECLDMPVGGDPFDPLVTGTPVECAAPHNGEVFGLAEYPDGWAKPSEEPMIRDGAWQEEVCPLDELDAWLVPGSLPSLPLRILTKVGVPSDAAWEEGDRTVRCVAFALTGPYGKEKMSAWTGTIPDKLTTTDGLKFFATCAKAKPVSGSDDNAPYVCKTKKQWIAVTVAPIKGKPGKPYPGGALQKSADRACTKAAKPFIEGKAKPLGIVVSKFLWDLGLKEAHCYIPLNSWNGKSAA